MLRHLGHREKDIRHVWKNDLESFGGYNLMTDGSGWIKIMKSITTLSNNVVPALPETLNPDQNRAIQTIMDHYNTPNLGQLRLIVAGTAGSGKSYLINVIR